MKLEKLFSPKRPDLFTDEELNSFKVGAYKATGKMVLGLAGIATLGAGAATENIPTAVVGLIVASYGFISGSNDSVKLSDIEREFNTRPQAEALPLEFTEDK